MTRTKSDSTQWAGVIRPRTTNDYQKLLADRELNAIAVVTPVATHYPIAKAALLAKKHVLVEKPLTSTARQAEELIALRTVEQGQACDSAILSTVVTIRDGLFLWSSF